MLSKNTYDSLVYSVIMVGEEVSSNAMIHCMNVIQVIEDGSHGSRAVVAAASAQNPFKRRMAEISVMAVSSIRVKWKLEEKDVVVVGMLKIRQTEVVYTACEVGNLVNMKPEGHERETAVDILQYGRSRRTAGVKSV